MKKLITTAIVAAAAFGAFAIETGVWFETHEIGDASIESLNAAAGITAEGEAYWSQPSTAEDNEYKVKALTGTLGFLPQANEFTREPQQELSIKTTFGQPLSFNVNADKSSESFENGNIYFDSLMKFTVCEEEPETDSYNGAKIVMWLQEKYDAETDEVVETNIMVKAGYLASEGWTNAVYECQRFTGDISAWHRVTIKTIADITSDGSGVPGFIIYLNGDDNGEEVDGVSTAKTVMSKSKTPKWETALELTESAYYFNNAGAVFPSMTQSGNQKLNLTSVAFDGTGSINMLRFTAETIGFADDYSTPKGSYTIGENASLIDFTSIEELVSAINGYDGDETDINVEFSKGIALDSPIVFDNNINVTNIVIDFNGCIITNAGNFCAITNNAVLLTLKDSLGTGGIFCDEDEDNNPEAVYTEGDAGLNIQSGNFWGDIVIAEGAMNIEISGGSFQQDEVNLGDYIVSGKKLQMVEDGWYTVVDLASYDVTFMVDEVVYFTTNVVEGTSVAEIVPADPTKTGYNFTGWDPEVTTITADTTFTAQWEAVAPTTYTITYVLVAETEAGDAPEADSYTVESGTVTLTQPDAVAGYTFSGWYAAQELTGDVVTQFTVDTDNPANKTFYGKFTATPYTITYVLVDESEAGDAPEADSYTVKSGTVTLTQPAAVEGYTFSGWYADQELTDEVVTQFTVVTANLGDKTFYGKFTADDPAEPETPVISAGDTSVEVAGDANANAEAIADQVKLEVTPAVEAALGTGEGSVSKETYQGYFKKTARYDGTAGKWTVTAEITEEVKATAAESAVEGVLESTAAEPVMYVPRGLYYKITTMDDLGGTPSTPVMDISNGDPIPVIKPGSSKGFIKIQLGTKSFE